MDLIIASNNAHKVMEIRLMLDEHFRTFTLAEKGIDVEVDETGDTFAENALLKAKTIAEMTGCVCLADDTGLCVDALGGAPGVHSARYAGEHDNVANRAKMLRELKGVPMENRTAHFCTVMVLYYPDGRYLVGEGRVDGHILEEERGQGGFGYDVLFFCDEIGQTFGECTQEEKNRVSHRSRALHDLVRQL